MSKNNRWALLKHIGAPDDPVGFHYDLLIEDRHGCRTWRLASIPEFNLPPQKAIKLPTHKIDWLNRTSGKVSGNRGSYQRVLQGSFVGKLPSEEGASLCIELHSPDFIGVLSIQGDQCSLRPLTD